MRMTRDAALKIVADERGVTERELLDFVIGTPVREIPKKHRPPQSRFQPIFDSITSLEVGELLPVTFQTKEDAAAFCCTAKRYGYAVTRRQKVVYVLCDESGLADGLKAASQDPL